MRCAFLPSDSVQVHFYIKKNKEVLDQKRGKERKRWRNKWWSADGCYLLALSWDRGRAREEQAVPVLCSAELSLCFILLSPVSPSGSQSISRLGRCGGCDRLQTDPVTP